jgi:hypothetical protein
MVAALRRKEAAGITPGPQQLSERFAWLDLARW